MKSHALRDALVVLADTGEAPSWVRSEIAESWSRSLRHGLDPDRLNVPTFSETTAESAPMRAAVTVLNGLAEDLEGEEVGILLSDAHGRVIDRWVGALAVRAARDAPAPGHGKVILPTCLSGTSVANRTDPAEDLHVTQAWGGMERPSVHSMLVQVREAIEALLERRLDGPFAARDQAAYERLTKLETDLLLVEFGSGDRD